MPNTKTNNPPSYVFIYFTGMLMFRTETSKLVHQKSICLYFLHVLLHKREKLFINCTTDRKKKSANTKKLTPM